FESFIYQLRAYFPHYRRKSGCSTDLRDSGAHQSTPDDSHFFDRHTFLVETLREMLVTIYLGISQHSKTPQSRNTECSKVSFVQSSPAAPRAGGSLSNTFQDHRNPLPPADARRRKTVPQSVAPQFIQQRDHQASSGRSQWMSESDRPAVHVGF